MLTHKEFLPSLYQHSYYNLTVYFVMHRTIQKINFFIYRMYERYAQKVLPTYTYITTTTTTTTCLENILPLHSSVFNRSLHCALLGTIWSEPIKWIPSFVHAFWIIEINLKWQPFAGKFSELEILVSSPKNARYRRKKKHLCCPNTVRIIISL